MTISFLQIHSPITVRFVSGSTCTRINFCSCEKRITITRLITLTVSKTSVTAPLFVNRIGIVGALLCNCILMYLSSFVGAHPCRYDNIYSTLPSGLQFMRKNLKEMKIISFSSFFCIKINLKID